MSVRGAFMRFGGLAAVGSLLAIVLASGVWRHLSASEIQARHTEIAGWVFLHPGLSLAGYVATMALAAASCLPALGVLVVLGGILFGPAEGGLGALVGTIAGSTLVFLACRAATGGWLTQGRDGRVARIVGLLANAPFRNLLVLRLTPIVPLSLVNIAAGLAQVRIAPFVASGLLGSAPSNLIYASLGAGLRRTFDGGGALDLSLAKNPGLLWPLLALFALAAITAAANLRRRR